MQHISYIRFWIPMFRGGKKTFGFFPFFLTCLWTDIDFRWAVCHSEDPSCILICEYLKRVSNLRDIAFSSIVALSYFSISTEFGFHKGTFGCRIRLLRGTVPIQISSQVEYGHFVFLDDYNMAVWLSGSGLASRGEFRPRQTRQLPRAVDLKGRLLSCQSY